MKAIIMIMIILICSTISMAAEYTTPNTFQPNTPAVADEVNANFSAAETAINDNHQRVGAIESKIKDEIETNISALEATVDENAENISEQETSISSILAPRRDVVTYSAMGFHPQDDTQTYTKLSSTNGFLFVSGASTDGRFTRSLALPQGVVIKRISALAFDADVFGRIEIRLHEGNFPISGDSNVIATLGTTDADSVGSEILEDDTLDYMLLSGPEFYYWIEVFISRNTGAVGFFSITIKYEYSIPE